MFSSKIYCFFIKGAHVIRSLKDMMISIKFVPSYFVPYTQKCQHYIFKKLGNFERSLNCQLDILKMCSLQYLPSSSLLKMWNKLLLGLSIFKNRLLNSLFENYITMCYKPNCYLCKTNQICFNIVIVIVFIFKHKIQNNIA